MNKVTMHINCIQIGGVSGIANTPRVIITQATTIIKAMVRPNAISMFFIVYSFGGSGHLQW